MGFGFGLFYIILVIIIFIIIFAVFVIIKFSGKKKKLNRLIINNFVKNLKQIKSSISAKEQVIDYDKLYHKILLEFGYSGDFGSILKQNPSEIFDINKVWELHKLRNKLVHDFDLITESVLKKKALQYEELVNNLLK